MKLVVLYKLYILHIRNAIFNFCQYAILLGLCVRILAIRKLDKCDLKFIIHSVIQFTPVELGG